MDLVAMCFPQLGLEELGVREEQLCRQALWSSDPLSWKPGPFLCLQQGLLIAELRPGCGCSKACSNQVSPQGWWSRGSGHSDSFL